MRLAAVRQRRPSRRQPPVVSPRLRLEALEDRTLLSQSAVQVLDINPGVFSSNPTNLFSFNGKLFLAASDNSSGSELWKSDGTSSGTALVKDINPGGASSNPGNFTAFNGTLYFTATTAANGTELWKSNGLPNGTSLVKDINPGTVSSTPSFLTVYNGFLYFAANDSVHGSELWRSDGTPGGTLLFADINPTAGGDSNPAGLTVSNGLLFFRASDGVHGTELWKTDGTNTTMVADLNTTVAGASSSPVNLTNFNNTLYFSANDGVHGSELWKSDGTTTTMVADINPTSTGSGTTAGSFPSFLTVSNNTLYFAATDGTTHGNELWKVSAGGTLSMVADINPGPGDSSPAQLADVNGRLFFRADDGTHGLELWKTDGSTTTLVKDINPGANPSAPNALTAFNGLLYFAANDGVHGNEVWKSDGTPTGTVLLRDVDPGASGSSPNQFTAVGNTLFFRANDGVTGAELWKVINDFVVTGSDFGVVNSVGVFDSVTGQPIRTFSPYAISFRGGVRVAVGDVNGDGIPDIITAPGPTGGPDVRIFDGVSGKPLGELFAYSAAFTGGVYVASADLNGDGLADIITGPDAGGGPDVRVFDGFSGSMTQEFFPYNVAFTGGVRVAAGDVNDDGTADIVTSPGAGGGPDVRVFSGKINGQQLSEVIAFNPGFTGGVYVAAADLNGDGHADIVTGAGAGGGPNVRAFSGANLAVLDDFFAYATSFAGGVRVGVINDIDGDGRPDLITSPGPGGGPDIRLFGGLSGTSPLLRNEFFSDVTTDTAGVFVGGSHG